MKFIFVHINWEWNNHPNGLHSIIFQRGRLNHQPVYIETEDLNSGFGVVSHGPNSSKLSLCLGNSQVWRPKKWCFIKTDVNGIFGCRYGCCDFFGVEHGWTWNVDFFFWWIQRFNTERPRFGKIYLHHTESHCRWYWASASPWILLIFFHRWYNWGISGWYYNVYG